MNLLQVSGVFSDRIHLGPDSECDKLRESKMSIYPKSLVKFRSSIKDKILSDINAGISLDLISLLDLKWAYSISLSGYGSL